MAATSPVDSLDVFGTADWASDSELVEAGVDALVPLRPPVRKFLLGRTAAAADLLRHFGVGATGLGSLVGKLFGGSGQIVGWEGDGHLIAVAPTRSGKGVGLVIPNLLTYAGSIVVIDPKGENYRATHKARRAMGQVVVRLDPFQLLAGSTDFLNPLDGLRPDTPELSDEVSIIADAMVLRPEEEKDPHWNDKARAVLRGLTICAICQKPGRATLADVRRLSLDLAQEIPFTRLQAWMMMNRAAAGGMVGDFLAELSGMGGSERMSVISAVLKHSEFLSSPEAGEALGASQPISTYDVRQIKKRGRVTLYIVLPAHYLKRYNRLLRVWIACIFRAMTQDLNPPADGRVLFLLDEVAQLGRLDQLVEGATLMAGYGLSMWLILQDLAQLKAVYPKEWSTFLANSRVIQFFGVNDMDTAKHISDMLGTATVENISSTEQTGKNRGRWFSGVNTTFNRSEGTTTQQIGRALLLPDEVRRVGRETVITFVQGSKPALLRRLTYFKDAEFKSLI